MTAAVLLLIATGMLLENTSRQLDSRILYDTDALVTARIELPDEYDPARGGHFFDVLLERVRAIDGVSTAALADAIPGGEAPSPRGGLSAITAENIAEAVSGPPRRLDGGWIFTTPRLLETLGLTLTSGRDFDERDVAGSEPAVIVSESIARRLWPIGGLVLGWRALELVVDVPLPAIHSLVPLAAAAAAIWFVTGDPLAIQTSAPELQKRGA